MNGNADLYTILPLPILVVSYKQKRPDFICDTGVPAELCFHRSSLNRSLQNIPILLFKRLSCSLRNLSPQSKSITGLLVPKVSSSIFSLEEWGIQDVGTCMFDWR